MNLRDLGVSAIVNKANHQSKIQNEHDEDWRHITVEDDVLGLLNSQISSVVIILEKSARETGAVQLTLSNRKEIWSCKRRPKLTHHSSFPVNL